MAGNRVLIGLTVAQLREGLRRREFSAVELVESHMLAAERAKALGGFITQTPDIARDDSASIVMKAFIPGLMCRTSISSMEPSN